MNYSRYNIASNNQSFGRVLSLFPTENIRVLEENGRTTIYLAYMTDNGYMLYLFFTPEDRLQRGYSILMSKALSYSDFRDIKEGVSTIDDVGKLEKAALLTKKVFEAADDKFFTYDTNNFDYANAPTTTFLLTDGVLTIHYAKTDGVFVVKKMVYSKDFLVSTGLAEEYPGGEIPDWLAYDRYKIYPQDYVTGEVAAGATADKWPVPAELTPDTVDWSVSIAYGNETCVYTKEMALSHGPSAAVGVRYILDMKNYGTTTGTYRGVLLTDVLDELNIPEVEALTIESTDGTTFEIAKELIYNRSSVLARIIGFSDVVENSDSHVAFVAEMGGPANFAASVKTITIH